MRREEVLEKELSRAFRQRQKSNKADILASLHANLVPGQFLLGVVVKLMAFVSGERTSARIVRGSMHGFLGEDDVTICKIGDTSQHNQPMPWHSNRGRPCYASNDSHRRHKRDGTSDTTSPTNRTCADSANSTALEHVGTEEVTAPIAATTSTVSDRFGTKCNGGVIVNLVQYEPSVGDAAQGDRGMNRSAPTRRAVYAKSTVDQLVLDAMTRDDRVRSLVTA